MVGSGARTAISPVSPGASLRPSLSMIATSWPGAARPVLPGFGAKTELALVSTRFASVWPKNSLMVSPSAPWPQSSSPAPSASPADPTEASRTPSAAGSGPLRISFSAVGGMKARRTS